MAKSSARGAEKVSVGNINVPGHRTNVDAGKYGAMKEALLEVLPREGPGMTQAEMFAAVVPHLSQEHFPGGAKAGWWVKCVQLDLETTGEVIRDRRAKPLRWRRGG